MSGYQWDDIKASVNIVEVIGAVVDLRRKGKLHEGLCPFHGEKTPSFKVYEDNFHCFGCGANGDAIDFVMKLEGCGHGEAIERIAGKDFSLSDNQRAEVQQEKASRMEREDQEREAATIKAQQIWESAEQYNPAHPYLALKGIPADYTFAIRQHGKKLIVPVYTADGDVQSIQTIEMVGEKGEKKNFPLAPMTLGRMGVGIWSGRIILCEGFATAASIWMAATEYAVVTFGCDNMEKVAREYHAKGKFIALAADLGPSALKMTALAEELGCPVIIPPAGIKMPNGNDGTDFNDQHVMLGADAVSETIKDALASFANKKARKVDYLDMGRPDVAVPEGLPFDISNVDLMSPPGFVGQVSRWIESQSRRPRPTLAVAAALTAVGNVAGLRYEDARDGVTTNLFAFCVAGSRTGKESIQQAVVAIHKAAHMGAATHGSIKSEQEIVRNLTSHQAAFYVIDEIAHLLRKVKNAQKSGGAAYLDGIIGMLMSAYSKASGFMLLTGDQKRDAKAALVKDLSQVEKLMEEDGKDDFLQARSTSIRSQLETINDGIDRPFLSMIGFTTPVDFDDMVDFHSATNGFIGRSLLFNERNTAPRSKKGFIKTSIPQHMAQTLSGIAFGGSYDQAQVSVRIENYGDRIEVPTESGASILLNDALVWFDDTANNHKGESGLESLYIGAYEIMAKISFILAIPEGIRTAEHVMWAFAMVKRDVEEKIRLVTANDRVKDSPLLALQAKIANICAGEGETLGVIHNRTRGKPKDDVTKVINDMIKMGALVCEEHVHGKNKLTVKRYRTA